MRQEASEILSQPEEKPSCWLCGEPIAAGASEPLNIDGAFEDLHPDCGKLVMDKAG